MPPKKKKKAGGSKKKKQAARDQVRSFSMRWPFAPPHDARQVYSYMMSFLQSINE